MKNTHIRMGPLAILLTVVSICLAVLSVLAFTTSRADMALSNEYAKTVSTRYELESEGQEFLSEINNGAETGALSEEDGLLWKVLEKDGFILRIGIKEDAGKYTVKAWRHEKLWDEDTSMNIWDGK